MIAPERWHEYEERYQKYGLEMEPERQHREKKLRNHPEKTAAHSGSRKIALSAVLAIGAAMIVMIIMTAYSANIRYDINSTIKENNVLQGEIESLQVKVYSANNISYIEKNAKSNLKMVYPTSGRQVYISAEDVPAQGFADIIKEKAYN